MLETWNRLKWPPATALKSISAGRLRGKSDINPQWRYQALTEEFGICGVGWRFSIDKLWTEPGADGEIFAFAMVSLSVRTGEGWSDSIPGIGGNFLVEKEIKGLHNNDEGFKMAVTDAIGTAAKMIGVAADVYLGNWDGSKYRNQKPEEPPTSSAKPSNGNGAKAADPKPQNLSVFDRLRGEIEADKVEETKLRTRLATITSKYPGMNPDEIDRLKCRIIWYLADLGRGDWKKLHFVAQEAMAAELSEENGKKVHDRITFLLEEIKDAAPQDAEPVKQ